MLVSSTVALVRILLATTPFAGMPPSPPECEASPRPMELHAESDKPPPVVCISPDAATTLLFDTPLTPGAVEVQATEQELQMGQGRQLVTLIPSARLLPGEWRKMTVRFDDGAAPAIATLLLYVHPARAARQVEVQRKARTVESYQREATEWKEQARRYQEENARLQAAQGQTAGLRGLVSQGLIGEAKGGVASENIQWPNRLYTVHKGNALAPMKAWSYRSYNRVAVELQLELLLDGQPWVAEGATLVDAHGREMPVLPLWQAAPVTSKKYSSVVVEAEAPPGTLQGPYTLKLWEAGGKRSVILENIVFPSLPSLTEQ
ncbi:DUF2381 family protein [Hyalangium versicolor]|uniref:DUF2381 family protein n=1 Tax=Hyalangium versicolor TaxID=2861190 RepID=UPI001CC9C0A2|nr:DUF2381 family protein [Hyalangium versicolor]